MTNEMAMNALTDCYTLSNGVKIPCIGFGTWQTPDGEIAVSTVLSAIEAGYRHIDTAQGYGNEESVGIAVKKSGVPRSELFITSKLTNSEHGYDRTLAAFEGTMKKLDTDYLDLFLIHWPNPIAFRDHWQKTNAETWKAFEELYNAKRIRAIGISNFRPHHIRELMKTAVIAPVVNQIRLCPGETQDEVVNFCRSQNILLEAYSPLGVGKIFEVPEMKALAEKYGKSIAQICIRWSLQRGYLPLPKSVTPARIKENAKVFDFTLEDRDVQLIAGLKGCVGYSTDPDTITF
jgi:diketogulonate reductase-like aldo/keto reductase